MKTDLDYLKEYIRMQDELFDKGFNWMYVKSDEDFVGFGFIEFDLDDDNDVGLITTANCDFFRHYYNVEEFMSRTQIFTMDRDFAFKGKFVTWDDFKKAVDGEYKDEEGLYLLQL